MTISPPSSPAIDLDKWIPIDEAAVKLSMHVESLGRMCRQKLDGFLAVMGTPPEGGKKRWYVHRSYHPALRNAEDQARYTPGYLSGFSEAQRNGALARLWCVEQFRRARSDLRVPMSVGIQRVITEARHKFPDLAVSESSLHAWHRLYDYPCNLSKLVDQRGGDKRHNASVESWKAFRDLYLHPNCPSIKAAWATVAQLAAENNWSWCSLRACETNRGKFISEQDEILHRQPMVYRQQMAPYVAQHPESWAAGELYISDHKAFDVICRCRKQLIRPWISTFMDWRTRKICGWVLSDNPNSTTILGALRHALMDPTNYGGPAHVWWDNGADYSSWVFHGSTKRERRASVNCKVDEVRTHGILNHLGIEAHFALPYCANGKARLERWHRTLEGFFKSFPTYTGRNAETKPETLNEILQNRFKVPSFEDVLSRTRDYIKGYNLRADHQIDDLSEDGVPLAPADAFAKWCSTRRVMADPAALDLILTMIPRPVTVGRNGISLTLNGQTVHYGQFSHELKAFKALRKADRPLVNISYDSHDLRTIRVFDEKFQFVCVAAMNEVGGLPNRLDKENFKVAAKQKTAYERAQKFTAEYAITSMLSSEEQVAIAAEQARKAATPEPPAMKMVATPMDGQAREQKRQEVKAAMTGGNTAGPVHQNVPSLLDRLRNQMPRHLDGPIVFSNPLEVLRGVKHA